MADYLSLTVEEWAALLAAIDIAEPLGVGVLDGATPSQTDNVDVGARSVVGRGLVDPAASGTDGVHPAVAQLLVAMHDAEEIVSVDVAHRGAMAAYAWYAYGDSGVVLDRDIVGNLRFRMLTAAAVADHARASLKSLRADAPAATQYQVDASVVENAIDTMFTVGEAVTIELGTARRAVEFVALVSGWRQTSEDELSGESLLVLGLTDHGTWVFDPAGESAVLTQLTPPWPSVLTRLAPR